ncbi:4-hydroxyphenylacetate 3-hydroxylase N-terminal domain-containing protein [Bradyrhizobium diazoefficiens]|uniref:4-hydroxyphenylacetate 3-hydroxylase N-terminal domain-containing protein n=1 Tax=Bradyrhizobium diazoefficiens TaxID=1355477 RepID=UPI0035961918
MPLRRGAQYKAALDDGRDVHLLGKKVPSVVREPVLSGAIDAVAQIYDRQFAPEFAELFTLAEGESGSLSGRMYQIPRSEHDIRQRGALIDHVARMSGGTMGRTPEYVPLVLIGLLDAAGVIARKNAEWAQNIARYYEHCRAGDLFLSHSFADRQVDRATESKKIAHLSYVPMEDGGIEVSGIKAVATSAPIADEFIVFTPPRNGLAPHQAVFFAVPINTAGLRFICRQPLPQGAADDHPLGGRFDEMDAWAIFDRVHVPRERVFVAGDVELVAMAWRNLLTLAYYHILVRSAVKADLFLGTSSLIAGYLGLNAFQGIRENLADIARYGDTIRAFARAAEADVVLTRGGMAMPNPRILAVGHMYAVEHHHRLRDGLVGIAGQSVLMSPGAADAEIPELAAPGQGGGDEERRRVFRLAWDLAGGAFAGRQYLFEVFNGRDLTRNRLAFFERFDLKASQTLALALAGAKRAGDTEGAAVARGPNAMNAHLNEDRRSP